MMVFAAFVLSYLLAFIATRESTDWVIAVMYFTTYLNLFLYLRTLLGDPGIDPAILEHYRSFEFEEDFVKSEEKHGDIEFINVKNENDEA